MLATKVRVSSTLSDDASVVGQLQSWGKEVLGPRDPGPADAVVMRAGDPRLAREAAVRCLREGKTPVFVDVDGRVETVIKFLTKAEYDPVFREVEVLGWKETVSRSSLPELPGYTWQRLRKDGRWARAFVPVSDEPRHHMRSSDPGDWQWPMPVKKDGQFVGKRWAKCYVNVRDLVHLPLWLLHNPDKVFLERWAATEQYFKYYETSPGDDRGAVHGWREGPDGWPIEAFRRTTPKNYLTGPEALERVPWDKSFRMSVMGWPLRFIPIAYLLFYASRGPMKRQKPKALKGTGIRWRDGDRLGWNEVWKDGRVTISFESMKSYEPLYSAVLRYLDSAEGRARLEAADLDLDKGTTPCDPEDVEWREFGGQGVWTGRNVLTRPETSYALFKKESASLPARPFTPTVRKDPEDATFAEKGLAAEEEFSSTDRDRFGPWGSGPTPVWIETGRGYSKSARATASAREGDADPTPPEYRLGLVDAGRSGSAARVRDQWTPCRSEEPDRDWAPPTWCRGYEEAVERCLRVTDFADALAARWDRAFTERSAGLRNMADREAEAFWADGRDEAPATLLARQQGEDLDLLDGRRDELYDLVAPVLLGLGGPEADALFGEAVESLSRARRACEGVAESLPTDLVPGWGPGDNVTRETPGWEAVRDRLASELGTWLNPGVFTDDSPREPREVRVDREVRRCVRAWFRGEQRGEAYVPASYIGGVA